MTSIMDVFCTLVLAFLACTCCTFCLSMAGDEHSQLEAIAPIVDALTVDVSAAVVVVSGYMFSNLYEHMAEVSVRERLMRVGLRLWQDEIRVVQNKEAAKLLCVRSKVMLVRCHSVCGASASSHSGDAFKI